MDGGVAQEAWLKDALVFLVAAGIVVPFFRRLRLSEVLGFLLAGIVVGPFGLGRLVGEAPLLRYFVVEDPRRIEPFAELGVVFLLFVLGLDLSLARLWQLRRHVLGTGSLQVVLSAAAIGGLALLGGLAPAAALAVGLGLALSSTAIVIQILGDQRRLAGRTGRVALAVLLLQDLAVVPILFVVGLLGAGRAVAAGEAATALAAGLLEAAAAVLAILLVGRYGLRPLVRQAALSGSRELIMAITLLAVVGFAVATEAAGLSLALGAFLAGALLAESEFRHQIEVDLDPFKGLLLGLFFTTVGMGIDPLRLLHGFGWVLAAAAALIAVKAVVLFAAARLLGAKRDTAAEVALLLGPAGEFAFVVIGLALAGGVLAAEEAQFVTLVVGLSMLATPLLAWTGRRLGARIGPGAAAAGPRDLQDLDGHVVIGGFGRVGRTVARMLEAEGISYVALDLDADRVDGDGRVFYGDAGRDEMLERAGADRARAFLVTLDAPAAAERMVRAVRRRRPDAAVYARAKDAAHAARLARLGAAVVPEAVEGSLQLGAQLLAGLGLPEEAVLRRLGEERTRFAARIDGAAGEGG